MGNFPLSERRGTGARAPEARRFHSHLSVPVRTMGAVARFWASLMTSSYTGIGIPSKIAERVEGSTDTRVQVAGLPRHTPGTLPGFEFLPKFPRNLSQVQICRRWRRLRFPLPGYHTRAASWRMESFNNRNPTWEGLASIQPGKVSRQGRSRVNPTWEGLTEGFARRAARR